jgi:hypothetical protein
LAADRKGYGKGEGSSDSEGLKVNGLRGFERSTPSRGIALLAGSEQRSNSGCRGLDRGRRPSYSNESVRSKKLVAAEQQGARRKGGRAEINTAARQTGRRAREGRERGEGRCWCFGGKGSR